MANRTKDSLKGRGVRRDAKTVAAPRQALAGAVQVRLGRVLAAPKSGGSAAVKGLIAQTARLVRAQRATQELQFGSVTVEGGPPSSAIVKRNIALGQSALKRGLKALVKPGVKLRRGKGVPIYRVDPSDPTILIRELNGCDERGTLTDGKFKIAE